MHNATKLSGVGERSDTVAGVTVVEVRADQENLARPKSETSFQINLLASA
jgi:hypothetical protein